MAEEGHELESFLNYLNNENRISRLYIQYQFLSYLIFQSEADYEWHNKWFTRLNDILENAGVDKCSSLMKNNMGCSLTSK